MPAVRSVNFEMSKGLCAFTHRPRIGCDSHARSMLVSVACAWPEALTTMLAGLHKIRDQLAVLHQ